MKTSNVNLLREIDSIEELFGVDANELFLVKEIDKMLDQITQLEKDKADLLAVLPNLISGWDYEELAHCGGVDADTAARVIKLMENAE